MSKQMLQEKYKQEIGLACFIGNEGYTSGYVEWLEDLANELLLQLATKDTENKSVH